MDEAKLAGQIIANNDLDINKRESMLVDKVNKAYKKAIEGAIADFRYLEKLNPNVKPSSRQVAKILTSMIEEFQKEMDVLVEPFQRELSKQYEEGLLEAAQILALREQAKES